MGSKRLGVRLEMHDSKPGVDQGLLAAEGVERESMQQREEKDWQWKTLWNCQWAQWLVRQRMDWGHSEWPQQIGPFSSHCHPS